MYEVNLDDSKGEYVQGIVGDIYMNRHKRFEIDEMMVCCIDQLAGEGTLGAAAAAAEFNSE